MHNEHTISSLSFSKIPLHTCLTIVFENFVLSRARFLTLRCARTPEDLTPVCFREGWFTYLPTIPGWRPSFIFRGVNPKQMSEIDIDVRFFFFRIYWCISLK